MTAPTPPAPPAPADGPSRWRAAAVDAWGVVVRCEVVLAGVAAVLAVVLGVSEPGDLDDALSILAFAWAVHAVLTLVVGYPVGVAVTRLLPPRPGRGRAGVVYALVGAGTAALIVLVGGLGLPAAAAWAALGAATAGTARVWADRAIRDRAQRREVPASPAPPAGIAR